MKLNSLQFLIIFSTFFASLHSINEQKIQLFIYKNCPYCQKVIKFLKEIDHMTDVELVDASNKNNQKTLQSISGSSQCPYLVDENNDVAMAESADIINYLKKRFKQL